MSDDNPTIFGKILRGEIPSDRVWEDEHCIAFRDIHPVAPVHMLVIPRKHIVNAADIRQDDRALVGHLLWVASQVAQQAGVDESGYRLVINCHDNGGQTVPHLHIHVLGGRGMSWPPG